MGHIPELSKSGLQFVPTRWGYSKNKDWPRLRGLFPKYRYPFLLAYNEPDVPSQSNYSPQDAAAAFQRELAPLRQYGTHISSPQICWNADWLEQFTQSLHNRGGYYDFIAAHYYGSWNSIDHLKSYVKGLHDRFGKNIWITEYGVTSSSNPSAQQAKQFMIEATQFFASTGYVKRAFPFGMWATPPDSFGSAQNAAFLKSGELRSLGKYYRYWNAAKRSGMPDEVDPLQSQSRVVRRHAHLLARLAQPDPRDGENWDNVTETVHCDEACRGRESWMAKIKDAPAFNHSARDPALDRSYTPTVPIEDHVDPPRPEYDDDDF